MNLEFFAATHPYLSSGLLTEKGICKILFTSYSPNADRIFVEFYLRPGIIKSLTNANLGPDHRSELDDKLGASIFIITIAFQNEESNTFTVAFKNDPTRRNLLLDMPYICIAWLTVENKRSSSLFNSSPNLVCSSASLSTNQSACGACCIAWRADPVHTCVGLGRLLRAGIVVNVDPTYRGCMWAIECGPPSEDARPLMGGDCNAPSPTSGMFWEDHRYLSGGL
ncbi:hypothetical protein TorRG33x02_285350 [Trema orientale]|uniref:Uncharacterized protein n=1 Tax=Trema orientale TaxID=63057 RepID=A0A2P5CGN7_TREOI|nr:hypothetical protein TorRG33x02_285350 [Trema orientale]